MKKLISVTVFTVVLILLSTGISEADVRLPRIFSSHMVLQQEQAIPVWGWASPRERVTVTLGNTTQRTTADKSGKWKVTLPAMKYGGPYTMTVKGRNTLTFTDILVGEVWICSGQSNMEWPLVSTLNAEEEIATANFPELRLFTVPRKISSLPLDDLDAGEWNVCSPQSVERFSAIGYLFGRQLHQDLKVPVGLINSSWGGTVAETWISGETISKDPDFARPLEQLKNFDMKSFEEEKKAKFRKIFNGDFPEEDLGMENGKPKWHVSDLNDGNWNTLQVPKYWEAQGFAEVDGIGWYRKEITLTEEQSNAQVTLHLGKVDDSDITWVNGIEIGRTEGLYSKERIYTIDSKYLKPGRNMLVVRVNDTGGNGGIWGEPNDQFLAIGKEKVDISGDWKFRISKAVIGPLTVGPNTFPTLLFNSMIHPILPYPIRGAIWYQGESNADRAKQYQRIFPALITDWRNHWKVGDFPFLFVSLANFTAPPQTPGESEWAELREAQTKTLALPNTGMAVTIDIGEEKDIHPRNKQDVAKRLALNAMKIAYGKELLHSGPLFRSADFSGGKATVTFDHAGDGLVAHDRYGYVKGFTLAGKDGVHHWAQARIKGENQVEVTCDKVPAPAAVRYGWANNPDDVNLYNSAGLPANPFRTDE